MVQRENTGIWGRARRIYKALSSEIASGFEAASANVLQSLPDLIGAALLLVAGLAAAFLLKAMAVSILRRAIGRAVKLKPVQSRSSLVATLGAIPSVAGTIVFWLVFIFFILVIVESLGFDALSDPIARFTYYLPRIVAAIVMVIAGLVFGDLLRGFVIRSLRKYGFVQEQAVVQIAYGLVVFTAVVLAIDQLGIDSTIITWTFILGSGTMLGTIGLAFALGARQMVGHMLALRQIMREFPIGEAVSFGNIEGTIAGFSNVCVKIRQEDRELHVPASQFLDQIVTVKKPVE